MEGPAAGIDDEPGGDIGEGPADDPIGDDGIGMPCWAIATC
jgi:hypothetical protein